MEWEFGEGLSYVSVSVGAPRVSTASLDEKGSVTVTVDVTNHGVLAPGYKHGDEPALYSVLLFLFDLYRRVTPEYKLLKRCVSWSCRCHSLTLTLCVFVCDIILRFSKLSLANGETQTLSFTLTADDFRYVGLHSRYTKWGVR